MYTIKVTLSPNPLTSLRGLSDVYIDNAHLVYVLCRR